MSPDASAGCPVNGTSHPMAPRVLSRRAIMPVDTVQTTTASAPALRARSMSGVMSGWLASMLATTTASAPAFLNPAAQALAAVTP